MQERKKSGRSKNARHELPTDLWNVKRSLSIIVSTSTQCETHSLKQRNGAAEHTTAAAIKKKPRRAGDEQKNVFEIAYNIAAHDFRLELDLCLLRGADNAVSLLSHAIFHDYRLVHPQESNGFPMFRSTKFMCAFLLRSHYFMELYVPRSHKYPFWG